MPEFEHDIEDPLDCEYIELDQPEEWQSQNKTEAARRDLSRRATALSRGQAQPFWRKLDYAMRVIERAFLKDVSWGVSFSAGNDSTVLSHLIVEKMGIRTPHVMSNTRLEYPETIRNSKSWKQWLADRSCDLHVALPDMRPDQVWETYGIPLFSKELASKYIQWKRTGNDAHLRQVPASLHAAFLRLRDAGIDLTDKCCDELKKKPMAKIDRELGITGHLTGVRCQESQARRLAYIQRGSLYHGKRAGMWIANPLSHWLREDIQEYQRKYGIVIEQIPSASNRSGCVNCAFGCHIQQRSGMNSLQHLKLTNPKMHERTMSNNRFKEACDLAGIRTEPEDAQG